MPLDRAALIGCGVTTGVGAVFNTAKVEAGSTVAVIGCGGVGLNCIQGAAIAGAGKVIAVDMLESKLELARQFGATHTVDASQGDPVGQVRDLAGGGVHYAFEAIGMKQTSEQAFGMLRAGGTCTVIGMIPVGAVGGDPGLRAARREEAHRARTWAPTASASTCPATSTSTSTAASSSTSSCRAASASTR